MDSSYCAKYSAYSAVPVFSNLAVQSNSDADLFFHSTF